MASGCYRTNDVSVGANPQLAIDFVTEKQNPGRIRPNFSDGLYYKGPNEHLGIPNDDEEDFRWPNLCSTMVFAGNRVALLLSGTTSELKDLLQTAENEGIQGLEATGDKLVIWYLRRSAGTATKTLVLIAPKSRFLGVTSDDPAKNYDYTRKIGWRFMGVSPDDGRISLRWLRTGAIPLGEGVSSWW
jgi:hypothetical protein